MLGKLFGFAVTLFICAWLIGTAVGIIESVLTPLIIIGAVIVITVIVYRILKRRNNWW